MLRTELAERSGFDRIIGKSPSMQRMFQLLDKVTQVDSTVLITGESGVGKELIVQALHYRHRAQGRAAWSPSTAAPSPRT